MKDFRIFPHVKCVRRIEVAANSILLLGVLKWGDAPRPELTDWTCSDREHTMPTKVSSRIIWHNLQVSDANASLKHDDIEPPWKLMDGLIPAWRIPVKVMMSLPRRHPSPPDSHN